MSLRQEIKYYLLVTANPFSNSKAAISIFKMVSRLDILSGDITVFFPGFHPADSDKPDTEEEIQNKVQSILRNNQEEYEDFHGRNSVYHVSVEKEGDIYFNDADFSNFMLDLEEKSSSFQYYGRTDLVLIPSCMGEILYDRLSTYNLDDLSELNNSKMEEFLISVFKLIQKDPDCKSLRLIDKINDCYRELLSTKQGKSMTDVIIKLDNEILKYMKWKESDNIFFISYSTKDEFQAYALKGLLEKYRKKVWMAPEGIPNGFDYAQIIPAALRITSRFVVLLSHNSAQSTWVRREIGKAISNNTKIDGVFLDTFTFEDMQRYDHLDFMFENVQLRYSISSLFDNENLLQTFLND